MKNKPIAIYFLSLMHILEPLAKLVYNASVTGISVLEVFKLSLQRGNAFTIVEEFMLFPIAGIAIFLVKKWSYYLFLCIEAWVIWANITPLSELLKEGQLTTFWTMILFMAINIGVVTYFLLSAIKRPFHNPKIRWWESTPRYTIERPCQISPLKSEGKELPDQSMIHNISQSGLFISDVPHFQNEDLLKIEFQVINDYFRLQGKIMHRFSINNVSGMGLLFINLTPIQQSSLKLKMKELERLGAPRRPEKFSLLKKVQKKMHPKGELKEEKENATTTN